MSKNPTNWKDLETSMFQRKEKTVSVAKFSIRTSPGTIKAGDRDEGAWTVVSQYGGTASACALAYLEKVSDAYPFWRLSTHDGGASFCASSGWT